MKRKALWLLAGVVVFCIAVVGWFNLRTTMTTVKTVELSGEKALSRCPAVAVTENDRAMLADIALHPLVSVALAEKEMVTFSQEDSAPIKKRYVPDMERLEVSVTENMIYADIFMSQNERTMLSYSLVENRLMEKLVVSYGEDWRGNRQVKTLYGTDGDERFYKIVEKRDWFYFLKG